MVGSPVTVTKLGVCPSGGGSIGHSGAESLGHMLHSAPDSERNLFASVSSPCSSLPQFMKMGMVKVLMGSLALVEDIIAATVARPGVPPAPAVVGGGTGGKPPAEVVLGATICCATVSGPTPTM